MENWFASGIYGKEVGGGEKEDEDNAVYYDYTYTLWHICNNKPKHVQ